MNILIIEDEEKAALRLQKLIKNNLIDVNILAILDSVEESIKWFKSNPPPDIIFLDIQLSDGLSFNIFKEIEITAPIIFTTAYDEYALEAFKVNSIDYLLKPINESKLELSLKKYQTFKTSFTEKPSINSELLLELLSEQKKTKKRFLVNKGHSIITVEIKNIAYFYAKDKKVYIITFDNNSYEIKDTLDKLENDIEKNIMYRANRQVLLSTKSINKIHNFFNYKLKLELSPSSNLDIIISRSKVSLFKKWLSES